MGPKKAVAKKKESPVTVTGFDAELITQLSEGYPVLISKNEELVSKNQELTNRDLVSKKLMNSLKTENASQKAKIQSLENDILELKSLLEAQTTKDDAKELSKKSMEEVEDENAKLKVKTVQQKKEINMLTSKVHRLQSEIKQSEKNHQNEVKLLETQLNQQKEFVLGADVKNIIDKINEAHNEMISGMEKAHNLEKSAIRMDGENKVRILLELQKKEQDLNVMSRSLQNMFAQNKVVVTHSLIDDVVDK